MEDSGYSNIVEHTIILWRYNMNEEISMKSVIINLSADVHWLYQVLDRKGIRVPGNKNLHNAIEALSEATIVVQN